MAPLRDALRRPDRRTWRRFLPAARGAHHADVEPTAGPTGMLGGAGDEPEIRRRSHGWQVAAGVLILAAGIVVVGGSLPPDGPAPGADDELTPTPAPDAPPDDPPQPASPSPAPAEHGVRLWPAARVEVDGRQVRTEQGVWEVGAEGDVLAVGDWDCDRLPTPAVLRPGEGRVAVFDRWAAADAAEPARVVAVVSGAVGLRPGGTCGEAVVLLADGADRVLDTRPA